MSEKPRWPVPRGWDWTSIETIAEVTGGGTPSANDPSNFSDDGGIPWVTPADLTGYGDTYITRGRRNLSDRGYKSSSAKLLPAGAVLFTSRAPIGYCAIAANPIATNQGFKSLTLFGGISGEFTRHYLKWSKPYLESLASGTTFLELSGSKLQQVPFPLPPLAEQKRIVAKLDALNAKSARARIELTRIETLVSRYKQAVLGKAFSGEVYADGRVWTECKLDDVCKLIDGDRGANYPKREDYLQNGYCLYLSTKNVRPNGFQFDDLQFLSKEKNDKLRSGTLSVGDVIITTRGTVGNVAYFDESVPFKTVRINSGMLIARPVPYVHGEYLAWYFRSPQFVSQIVSQTTGSAQPQLPSGILKGFEFRYPDCSEQYEIVRRIESTFAKIDRLAKEAKRALELVGRLDEAILSKAFRGELVPQDEGDEPAERLLVRIRAERAAAQRGKRGRGSNT